MIGKSDTNGLPRVISFLKVGKQNGIKQKDLCELIGCNADELKAAVRRFRSENENPNLFICADASGYYIAKDRQEIGAFLRMMRRQATTRLETIRAGKRMLENPEGQESIHGAEV